MDFFSATEFPISPETEKFHCLKGDKHVITMSRIQQKCSINLEVVSVVFWSNYNVLKQRDGAD